MLTVTDEANSYALISLASAKTALGIAGTAEDAVLGDLIDRASDVIARHCNRVFASETVTEQFRLDRWRVDLLLSRYPVASIVSVVEGGVTLSATDYEVDPSNGLLSRLYDGNPCWWPLGKTVVTYSAGYALGDMPHALRQACLQLVKAYYIGADRDPLVRSESVTPMSSASYFVGDAEHLPPDVRGLLKQYRRIR